MEKLVYYNTTGSLTYEKDLLKSWGVTHTIKAIKSTGRTVL